MPFPTRRLALLGLLPMVLAAAPPGAQGSAPFRERLRPRVWTVDDDGPADFSTIRGAVGAATSGDVIRVRAGIYRENVVVRKGLELLGDPGAALVGSQGPPGPSEPLLRIEDSESSEVVVLRGLDLQMTGLESESALTVRGTSGPVWIEDCSIRYGFATFAVGTCFRRAPCRAILVQDAEAVVIVRSAVEGLPHPLTAGVCWSVQRTAALEIVRSSVSAFETTFHGVRGMATIVGGTEPGRGSDGAFARDSAFLYAAACDFRGGDGGDGLPCTFPDGAEGGSGLVVDATSAAHALQCTFAGGKGGAGVPLDPNHPACPDVGGANGEDGIPVGPGVEMLAGVARAYVLTPDAGDPSGFTLNAMGPAGDLVVSVSGSAPDLVYLALHQGTLLVRTPLTVVVEGAIPGGGVLTKPVPLPVPLRLVGFRAFFSQGLFFDGKGRAYLASGSSVLVTG